MTEIGKYFFIKTQKAQTLYLINVIMINEETYFSDHKDKL